MTAFFVWSQPTVVAFLGVWFIALTLHLLEFWPHPCKWPNPPRWFPMISPPLAISSSYKLRSHPSLGLTDGEQYTGCINASLLKKLKLDITAWLDNLPKNRGPTHCAQAGSTKYQSLEWIPVSWTVIACCVGVLQITGAFSSWNIL